MVKQILGLSPGEVPDLVATYDSKSLSTMDIVVKLIRVVQKQQSEMSKLKEQVHEIDNLRHDITELRMLLK